MNDTNKLINPQAIAAVYDDFPKLIGSELSGIIIRRDEPRLSIKLITNEKPTRRPKKWPNEYDEVQIEISFIGVKNLRLTEGWGSTNIIDEVIFNDDINITNITFFYNNKSHIAFTCDWIRIDSIVYGYTEK